MKLQNTPTTRYELTQTNWHGKTSQVRIKTIPIAIKK